MKLNLTLNKNIIGYGLMALGGTLVTVLSYKSIKRSRRELKEYISKIKDTYNLNDMTHALAEWSLNDETKLAVAIKLRTTLQTLYFDLDYACTMSEAKELAREIARLHSDISSNDTFTILSAKDYIDYQNKLDSDRRERAYELSKIQEEARAKAEEAGANIRLLSRGLYSLGQGLKDKK